jgi:Ca2+/H+ antiporter
MVEIGALGAAAVLSAALLADGRSSRLKGALLIAGYVAVAVAFFIAGER